MAATPSRIRRKLLAFSLFLVAAATGCGRNPAAHFHPPKGYQVVEIGAATVVLTDAELALRQALDAPTTLQFEDVPLAAVAEEISRQHGIRVVLDVSIEDALGSDAPVTFAADAISLRSALKNLLEQLDGAYWTANESLVLGTKAAAEDHMVQRVYYVRDLVEIVDYPGGPPAQALLGWTAVQTASNGLKWSHIPDYDSLMDVIREIIEPESWDDVGGPGAMEPFPQRDCLVISQTNDVHDLIEDLFRRLRTIPRP